MAFNLYYLFYFTMHFVIFSIDYIDPIRFSKERKAAVKLRETLRYSSLSESVSNHKWTKARNIHPLERLGCRWILGWRYVNFINLIWALIHQLLVFLILVKSLTLSLFLIDTNTSGDDAKLPARFMQIIQLFSPMNDPKQTQVLNRIILCLMFPILLARFKSFKCRLSKAYENRKMYKLVEIIQVNIAYETQIKMNFTAWMRIILGLAKFSADHDCNSDQSRASMMKKLSSKIANLSKIDRLYFFNQIEFGSCFFEFIKLNGLTTNTAMLSREEFSNLSLNCRLESRADQDLHLAHPRHRFCPIYLRRSCCFFIFCIAMLNIIMVLVFFSVTMDQFERLGFDQSNFLASLMPTLLVGFRDARFSMVVLDVILTEILFSLNLLDNGLLVESAIVFHSRASKVISMLKQELNQLRRLNSTTKRCQHQFYSKFSHSQLYKQPIKSRLSRTSENLLTELKEKTAEVQNSAPNDNLMYLINLVNVLQDEQIDLKKRFNFHLNIHTIFCTLGTALMVGLMMDANKLHEQIFLTLTSLVCIAPILIAMIFSAISETSVSSNWKTRSINATLQL